MLHLVPDSNSFLREGLSLILNFSVKAADNGWASPDTARPQGQKNPWDCAYLKKKFTCLCVWLDCTSLLLFGLTDLKSCCVANSSHIKTVSEGRSLAFIFWIISMGAWDNCKLLHQHWITPSFAYLSTTYPLWKMLLFHWTKKYKKERKNIQQPHFQLPKSLSLNLNFNYTVRQQH